MPAGFDAGAFAVPLGSEAMRDGLGSEVGSVRDAAAAFGADTVFEEEDDEGEGSFGSEAGRASFGSEAGRAGLGSGRASFGSEARRAGFGSDVDSERADAALFDSDGLGVNACARAGSTELGASVSGEAGCGAGGSSSGSAATG